MEDDTPTAVDFDLAYSSEKLLNLDVLLMYVTVTASNRHNAVSASDAVLKTFEIGVLTGFLSSELTEIESILKHLQHQVSSLDSIEDALKQSNQHVSDIKSQLTRLDRENLMISIDDEKEGNGDRVMLDKTISKQLVLLERQFSDTKHAREGIAQMILHREKERSSMEEVAMASLQRLFDAENTAEILMGVSKDLLVQLDDKDEESERNEYSVTLMGGVIDLSSLKISREDLTFLRRKVEDLKTSLRNADSEVNCRGGCRDCDVIVSLKECNRKADGTERGNLEIRKLLEKASLVERELEESITQLENTKRSVEAIEEEHSMLCSALGDMEDLVEHLKSKVSDAERKAMNAESRCVLLTQTNLELNEELNVLNVRLEWLEKSVSEANRFKTTTAKEIYVRSKIITDLITRLASERERLHLQVFALKKERRRLVDRIWKSSESSKNIIVRCLSMDSSQQQEDQKEDEYEDQMMFCAKKKKMTALLIIGLVFLTLTACMYVIH